MIVESSKRVLLVDDQSQVRDVLAGILRAEGLEVETTDNVPDACRMLDEGDFALLFAEWSLAEGGGLALLDHIRRKRHATLGIVVTAHGSLESALQALRARAFDYITKPIHLDEVRQVLGAALKEIAQSAPVEPKSPAHVPRSKGKKSRKLIGKSPKMRALNKLIETVAGSASTVLIRGESGTGKELIAQALHALSPRAKQPHIPVNCGAIPEDLLESELFGHVRGSFTGAITDRAGRFVLADKGTIFLDEIGDMSPKLQVKVLRVLQEQELEPVGAAQTISVDTRVLAATNVDLEQAVREKRFREDLYYRLNVIPIEAPPPARTPRGPPASHQALHQSFQQTPASPDRKLLARSNRDITGERLARQRPRT